jgi:hypothetical protein
MQPQDPWLPGDDPAAPATPPGPPPNMGAYGPPAQTNYPVGPLTDQKLNNQAETILGWVLAVLTLGYFLPWAIAATRGKSNSLTIFLVNLLLGWTLIGWIAALVMACMAHRPLYVVPQTINVNVHQAPHSPTAPFAAPGWYPQPDGRQRYWNGTGWTDHIA